MPGDSEPAAVRDGSARPNPETVYHVRVIHAWADEVAATAATSAAPSYSFFGLELELTGSRVRDTETDSTLVSVPLHFGNAKHINDATVLATLGPPFKVRVIGKRATRDVQIASNKLVLQRFIAVQPLNALLEINSVCFLNTCATGTRVLECLQRVLTHASLATPFDVTFQRHNHAEAAAKIVPFAMRADVQRAQVAQFMAMQAQEAQLSTDVRQKKQCITQQIDYEQEQYLFAHVGPQLFRLYDAIMAGGQWQAYEFDQALWYYHAPTTRLHAEHPMRSSGTTRRLIGAVQLTTRFAVLKLQRVTRACLRRSAVVRASVDHSKLLEMMWEYVWEQAWTRLQEEEEKERKRLKETVASKSATDQQVESAAAVELLSAAEVAKHSIPPSATAPVASESRTDVTMGGPDSSSLATMTGTDPVSSLATVTDLPCESPTDAPLSKGTGTRTTRHSYESDDDDDDDDGSVRWRGHLTLLKSNLHYKRISPRKHRLSYHQRQQQQQKPRARGFCAKSDVQTATTASVETQTQQVDDERESSVCLPRVHQRPIAVSSVYRRTAYFPEGVSSPKRASSSIAPPMHRDAAPFMLTDVRQRAALERESEAESALPFVSSRFEPFKVHGVIWLV